MFFLHTFIQTRHQTAECKVGLIIRDGKFRRVSGGTMLLEQCVLSQQRRIPMHEAVPEHLVMKTSS